MDFGSGSRKTAKSYAAYGTQDGTGFTKFGNEPRANGERSGTFTPPLWKSTSPPTGPEDCHDQYRSLSPTSRTQLIAQGQMELMEKIRSMPESYYELSLRDIVEDSKKSQEDGASRERRNDGPDEENMMSRSGSWNKRQNSRKSYLDANANMVRSGSIDNGGFLLKMVFPASSLVSKQKRKNSSSTATSGSLKMSPRPALSDGPVKGLDKEWWKKFSASGKVEHGIVDGDSGSMKSSGSSSSNSKNDRNGRYSSSILFI
ncbi:hypothetical protein CDL15_Pgr024768 [Punica granatum]|uniref:Uncharacterized protein n=1 Tax=Punica granatum TaxID=22663 RepID=A0A218VV88_PUNGR|nr:hypothetical protein CDL15_Pgr024768 [Punica granatum]PKI50554.1 hypothetical protein CRG98_029060 [Punica granatum]